MNPMACRFLLLSIGLLLPLRAADPTLVNLTRPDVNFMLGIHVSKIASSPIVATAMQEAQRSNPDWGDFIALLGPNPFSYLEEIVVSARLDERRQGKEPNNLLVLARGFFEDESFSEILCRRGCETDEYREIPLLRFQPENSGKAAYFARLESSYAAMGTLEDIQGVIDRRVMETESIFSDTIQQGIERLGKYHVWLAAKGSLGDAFGDGEDAGAMMAADAASKIDGFGLGLTLGNDVEIALELRSHNEEHAKQLFDMAQGFLALAKAGEAKPETKAMLERLTIRHDGMLLGASIRIPEEEVFKQIREQTAKLREQEEQAVTQPPARPRRPGGIRIYGLEPEPVEVPATKPQ